ncbi:DEAD/DEAH box helicase [Agrobacterium tumefaciens]|uniref:DEAD/DEAH-box helicase domain-containing protein n=1 Tax=Agrobacterium tumefaciens TaxID=358 RepID=A0AA44F8P2_AGRTU|nr:DEAD/DEAH box helicase [Agrobacterium tumefaciens]NTB86843.1 hypothetical protein [Agrobacterium tumefaciens]NTC21172.1 hypothetical protein [Agrobacterium tumefaciens]NTC30720.1 hypothetical protein [Agrobacterium tumefaciens]
MTNFQYVNAICGSGKTTSLINFYKKVRMSGSRLVIAQPTIDLMKSTAERFKSELGVSATLVYREAGNFASESAASQFKAALLNPSLDLIFVTQKTLIDNPYFEKANAEKTYLVIDELPAVETSESIQLNSFKHVVSSNMAVVPSKVDGYYNIIRSSDAYRNGFDDIKTDKNDSLVEKLESLFGAVDSVDMDAIVASDVWDSFVNPDRSSYQLNTHLIVHPTIFRHWDNVILMGANFLDSMLYKAWSTYEGVTFTPWNHAARLPTIHSVETGNRTTITYCIDQNWSQHLNTKHNVLPIIAESVAKHFEGRSFIWTANKSVKDADIAPIVRTGIKAPVISHGINEFRHINNAVFLPALNDTPVHMSFLETYFGIEKAVLAESKSFETAYQFAMRTSLRMPDATDAVEIVVVDKRTAEFLATKIPGSSVRALGVEIVPVEEKPSEKPVRALTGAERVAKKRKIEKRSKAILDTVVPSEGKVAYTRWSSIDNKTAKREDHLVSLDDFAARMEALSNVTLNHKFDGWLMNGAGVRKAEDAYSTNLLMLDIDKTEIKPTEISKIIDCAHIVHNSYSNNSDEIRYRVIVPLTHSCEDALARFVGDSIVAKIVAYAGNRKAGIDRVTPVGIYLEPTKPASGLESDHVFIKTNWTEKSVLNPTEYVSDLVKAEVEAEIDVARKLEAAQASVQALSSDDIDAKAADSLSKHASPAAGTGNKAFNNFAWSMAGKGIPLDQVELYLHRNADMFGSKKADRIKQIPNIMKNLRSGKMTVKPTPVDGDTVEKPTQKVKADIRAIVSKPVAKSAQVVNIKDLMRGLKGRGA